MDEIFYRLETNFRSTLLRNRDMSTFPRRRCPFFMSGRVERGQRPRSVVKSAYLRPKRRCSSQPCQSCAGRSLLGSSSGFAQWYSDPPRNLKGDTHHSAASRRQAGARSAFPSRATDPRPSYILSQPCRVSGLTGSTPSAAIIRPVGIQPRLATVLRARCGA